MIVQKIISCILLTTVSFYLCYDKQNQIPFLYQRKTTSSKGKFSSKILKTIARLFLPKLQLAIYFIPTTYHTDRGKQYTLPCQLSPTLLNCFYVELNSLTTTGFTGQVLLLLILSHIFIVPFKIFYLKLAFYSIILFTDIS